MKHILVVDDEVDLVWSINKSLRFHGYRVSSAHDGVDALRQIQHDTPDLIVLDIIMPNMDGVEVCQQIRNDAQKNEIPIIFLTAHSELRNKIAAYAAGADDYLSKPFDMHELILRIQAVIRRTDQYREQESQQPSQIDQLQVGQLHLNLHTATISTENGDAQLTPSELDLLTFLMQHPGQTFSSKHLLQSVCGYPAGVGDPALVRVHIRNLRNKIELSPEDPVYLRTIPRYGYTIANPITSSENE